MPEESSTVQESCENPYNLNVVTCKSPDLQAFLNEVDGLEMNTRVNSRIVKLPHYMPVFDKNVSHLPTLSNDFPVVGVSLIDIINNGIMHKAGSLHEGKEPAIRSSLLESPCFDNKKIILFTSGPDSLIENIWHKRHRIRYFEIISGMGLLAATGFNFSLINGECAFSQGLNIKRSLQSCLEYENSGIAAIPHVYALNSHQARRWVDWFRSNPNIEYFAINCQLQKSTHDINQVIALINYILGRLPRLHVILQGFPYKRLKDFNALINNIHIADASPVKNAMGHRKVLLYPGTKVYKSLSQSNLSVSELILNNIDCRKVMLDHERAKINNVKKSSGLLKKVS
ncbi:MAG: hypothetical protein WKF69_13520 [Daejeonella sp.]